MKLIDFCKVFTPSQRYNIVVYDHQRMIELFSANRIPAIYEEREVVGVHILTLEEQLPITRQRIERFEQLAVYIK